MPELPPIPDDSRLALSLLAGLTKKQRAGFVARMAQAAPTTSISHFAANMLPVEGLEYPELVTVLEELAGMKGALRPKMDVAQFAASVAAGMATPGLAMISDEDVSEFADFLSELLVSQTTLEIAVAADQMLHFSERVFDTATVITDLRAVFSPGNPAPVAMLPVHVLKITVVNSNQEFTFALDGLDLNQIQKELRKAKAQEAALREVVQNAGLIWVER